MNLITLEGALDLVGKAIGAGLFNLEQDLELQNMITLQGAKDLYGKAKGTGLFNLEQDLELQNLRILPAVWCGDRAGEIQSPTCKKI